jgi:hypothetical protein
VTIAEAKPGDPRVVHHVIVYVASPGRAALTSSDFEAQLLVVGGPGEVGFAAPEGTALRVPKGAELVFEMHYTPNGTAATDRTKIGLTFAKSAPRRELRVNLFGRDDFRIPAYAPHHKEICEFVFPKDGHLIGVLPHMHLRGKSFRYEATYPDGRTETIANVPRYDFNWQSNYIFDSALPMPKGTKVRGTAHWDNSPNNSRNPDPSREVRNGLQTSEEMMLGFLTYVLDEPARPQLPPAKTNPLVAFTFHSLDKNKNGVIEPDEMPAKMAAELRAEGIEVPKGISLVGLEAIMGTYRNPNRDANALKKKN